MDYPAVIIRIYDSLVSTLNQGSSILIADGHELAATLAVITISGSLLMWMLTGDGVSAMVESVSILLKFSVVTLMLAGWLGLVAGFFNDVANDIGGRVSGLGGGGATSSSGQRIADSVNTILIATGRLLVSERGEECSAAISDANVTDPEAGLVQGAQTCVWNNSGGKPADFVDLVFHFPTILVMWLVRLGTVLFMALMLAAYLAVIFVAEVSMGIGIILGPILVPWLIWPRMEFLFDGWLRFMIIATLSKIVAALMVAINATLIMGIKSLSDELVVPNYGSLVDINYMAAWMVCLVAALGTFVIWQVPSIAQALVSGGSGGAVAGFGRGAIGRRAQQTAGSGGKGGGTSSQTIVVMPSKTAGASSAPVAGGAGSQPPSASPQSPPAAQAGQAGSTPQGSQLNKP